jgi:arabinofuranan 3-O-arabinosyltransferase
MPRPLLVCLHYRSLVLDPQPSSFAPTGLAPGPDPGLYARLRSPSRLRTVVDYVAMAVVAFIPMLASQPGTVTDDTKTYLYLDPGRYVRQAVSLWDPNVGLGTVTHENIGYLLPMGPYYWAMAELHVPLWVAQRLWMGLLLFAAGSGALYLCRHIGLTGPGRYVTALAFTFTPYVLQYSGRISVILMPWAGLPWMIAFVILALRRGGWRYPALFALVVALVSGINASSILYVGIAPILWLPYAVIVAKESTWRRAWGVAWKVGVLSALVSVWWAVGLQVEAAYGVNVLKYTETVPTTSSASLASEIVRGLGYWYFYGTDRVGNWTQSAIGYTQNQWLIIASFVVPSLCFIAAAFARWRHRAYFVLITVVGMVLAVGPNPYDGPSAVGSVLKAIMVDTTAGLAMRSTDRASPLVILGLAMFLGGGVSALTARVRVTGLLVGGVVVVAIAAASAPLWTGAIVADGFTQPATPPLYVRQAAATLNHTHPGTRVYALPGNNFAAYRWGDTIDTVYPGLMTRPFVTHEQQIMGSIPTADLLQAIDSPLQDGVEDWNALAPMSSLMSAGDVLVQYDQAYERYGTPLPLQLAYDLQTIPAGLSNPVSYGKPRPNISPIPEVDEESLALPTNLAWPAPLVSYTVDNPRPIVRTESTKDPLIIDGDASGIVNSASVGLLKDNPTILYAGTLDTNAPLRSRTLAKPAQLVITDTNRKQGYRWNSLNDNTGYTETAKQGPDTADPSDAPIVLFPGAPADAQTTAVLLGISSVTASSYGSSVIYLPENRPSAALDNNTQTSWLDDSIAPPLGQWWQVVLQHPRTEHSITLVQPQTGDPDLYITKAVLTFDGSHPVTVHLGPSSRTAAGQVIDFPARSFSTLRITVTGVGNTEPHTPVLSRSSVGFAEVEIPGITANETIAMPEDLLRAAGTASISDRLSLVMTRLRSAGTPPRTNVETSLSRSFWLPTARTFSLAGQARISPLIPDDEIDRLVGRPGSFHDGLVAYSLGRLPGDLKAGAIAAVDDNLSTYWQPGFGAAHQAGQWLEYDLGKPITFDHLDLQVVADGQHSVPTQVTVTADGKSETVALPPIHDGKKPGSVTSVPVSFPALTGRNIRITMDEVRDEYTINYISKLPIALPLGIAEVGIPGVEAAPLPATIPTSCQNDLITVDGNPIWVSVSGSTEDALNRQALTVSLCGPDAKGLTLGPGSHTLRSAIGQTTGFDVDQLAFDSAPGGSAMPLADANTLAPPPVAATPTVDVVRQTSTALNLTVKGVSPDTTQSPLNLILGESINAGWKATVNGGSLGPPVLIDGFANGWRLEPATLASSVHDGSVAVVLHWQPQRRVNIGLLVSLAAIIACVVLALWPIRKRRRGRHSRPVGAASTTSLETTGLPSVDGPLGPTLVVPVRAEVQRCGPHTSVTTGVLTGIVAGAISVPVAGVAVGVATIVVLLVPRLRIVLGLAAVAGIVASGVYVAVHQAQLHVVPNGTWPLSFNTASTLAWAGVVFLGADAVVEVIGRRRRVAHSQETAAGGDPEGVNAAAVSAGGASATGDNPTGDRSAGGAGRAGT